MLVHNYELFKNDANESIGDTFTRFTNILHALKNILKVYSTLENVRKKFLGLYIKIEKQK